MATTLTLRVGPFFADGVTLGAYAFSSDDPDGMAPPVAATATVVVASGGVAAFTGLLDGTPYWIGTGAAPYRYLQATTAAATPSSGGSGGGVTLPWVTATAYVAGQGVTNGGRTYLAADAHTSGATFAGDLAAHWALQPAGAGAPARVVAGGSMGATQTLALLSTDGEVDYIGTLTANATMTITGLATGQSLVFLLTQDATGSRTFSITVGASTAGVPLNTAAGAYTVVTAAYDGTDLYVKGA